MPRHLATATNERIGPVTRPTLRGRGVPRVGERQPSVSRRHRRWLGITWPPRGQARAEQARARATIWTSHELDPMVSSGWQLVSHVSLERTDVDHVLAGPGGFYAMATSYQPDWGCAVDDLAAAAMPVRRAAHSLQMRMDLGRRPVQAVLVMWGPGAEQVAESYPEVDGVALVAGAYLAAWVRARPVTAGSVVVQQAVNRLHEHLAQHDATERAELARRL